ncbi:MAG: DNA topoisomerase I [Candidatus Asgardarchaeia archaeon]
MSKKNILIIAEKPSAAEKIASALGNFEKINENDAYYFKVELDGAQIFVAPAVGHLFGLRKTNNKDKYPVFNVEWAPVFEINKNSEYTRKYYENLKMLSEISDEVIIATDYDIEGAVIGYNIYRFLLDGKKVSRMKFSTLTKEELRKSFENQIPVDEGLTNAGLTRHILDWYYGINLSEALISAVKRSGKAFSIISIGRVQGPMLNFLRERELEIKKFVPKPYWQIFLKIKIDSKEYVADFTKRQIWDEKEADTIIKSITQEFAVVTKVKRVKKKVAPPVPFDLTSLQTEAYNLFGYSPKQTLDIAQSLYTNAYISYPRTSSQKLPKSLNLKGIIEKISLQVTYKKMARELLEKNMLEPHEGKKEDPAHPAIYPTGEIPKKLKSQEKKIYDLIVRRFLSCFKEDAERESITVTLTINDYNFKISGSRTVYEGWMAFYKPYLKLQEVAFPEIREGDKLKVTGTDKVQKETKPPKRYSQGAIIKELERRNIGTKATRAQILQTLYDRKYIVDKNIQVTDLGLTLAEAMSKYLPEIVDETLTRKFEEELDKIMKNQKSMDDVLSEARSILVKVIKDIETHKKEIGDMLAEAIKITREKERILGKCPKCGGDLKIIVTKKGRFVGCSNYPKCDAIYPLPRAGLIQKTGKVCDKCNTPIIKVIRKGKRPFNMCLDPNCETKKNWGTNKKGKRRKSVKAT